MMIHLSFQPVPDVHKRVFGSERAGLGDNWRAGQCTPAQQPARYAWLHFVQQMDSIHAEVSADGARRIAPSQNQTIRRTPTDAVGGYLAKRLGDSQATRRVVIFHDSAPDHKGHVSFSRERGAERSGAPRNLRIAGTSPGKQACDVRLDNDDSTAVA
jgi:hypothetical protein